MSHHGGKLYPHTCEICGKKFENDSKEARFCSRACTNKWLGKLRRERNGTDEPRFICKECGRKFSNKHPVQFCSKECREKYKLKQIEYRKTHRKKYKHTCTECEKEYLSTNKKSTFCSSKCAAIFYGKKTRVPLTCKYCGKPFWKKHKNGLQFCSTECRHKYNDERRQELEKIRNEEWIKSHTKECEICGKTFIARDKRINCCSEECREKYIKENKKKYNEYNSIRFREYALKKYKSKIVECKNCGAVFETEYGDKRNSFCCRECSKHYNRRLRKNNLEYKEDRKEKNRKRDKLIAENYVESVNYDALHKRDCGICKICGLPVLDKGVDDYWSGSIDHIVPLSLGGEHSMANCQLSHRICNSIKLQKADEFKIDWEEKSKESVYWKKKFETYKNYFTKETESQVV